MADSSASDRLQSAFVALRTAHAVLELERHTLEQFLEEEASVDSVMPIVDPTRWIEHQDEAAWRKPTGDLIRAAVAFLEAFDRAHQAVETARDEQA
jgi:hypothetical protein